LSPRARKANKLPRQATKSSPVKRAKAKDARLKLIFNTCSEEQEKVLALQNGVCYITGIESPLYLDHDHATGQLRGLLSFKVNKGLAMFDDNPEYLRRAADYLENPPYTIAAGENVYGVMGKVTKKITKAQKKKGITRVQRLYGPPPGSPTPQPRKCGKEKLTVEA
jgi:hypothetical protein